MVLSHFEAAVQQAMADCGKETLAVELGDSHRHALIKGKHIGLEKALEIYRKSANQDEDA
jgi:hypothetical protein